MTRSTFRVLFYANGSKEKNGIVPIMGRVTINGTVAQFSCKRSIAKELWDAKGNRAKGKSLEARETNLALDNIKAQIIKHYQRISDREALVAAMMRTSAAFSLLPPMGLYRLLLACIFSAIFFAPLPEFPYLRKHQQKHYDMITEKDAIDLINLAESLGITVFLDGGWGVDALLGRQTREHQDIDLFVEETQAARFIRALHQQGFKERTEAYSTPQHIVFADADGRTVDLHLFTYTSDGEIVFEGETYPADTFSGEGCIGEKKVSCIPPQAQVAFHTGYVFDENDVKDVLALCYRFHIPVPNEYLPYIN